MPAVSGCATSRELTDFLHCEDLVRLTRAREMAGFPEIPSHGCTGTRAIYDGEPSRGSDDDPYAVPRATLEAEWN